MPSAAARKMPATAPQKVGCACSSRTASERTNVSNTLLGAGRSRALSVPPRLSASHPPTSRTPTTAAAPISPPPPRRCDEPAAQGDQRAVGRFEAGHHGEEDREEADEGRDGEPRWPADADPDDEQGCPGDLRDKLDDDD